MDLLPTFKKCPSCDALNIIRTNGIIYENKFQSLKGWILKKIFNCKKCNVELGLFLNSTKSNEKKVEQLIWMELLNCEESHYFQLNELISKKEKYQKQSKRYFDTSNAIRDIQNKIRSAQVKVKIKVKIKNRVKGTFVVNAY